MKKGDPYFLSFILRHKPESIEVDMDSEGWISISQFIQQAKDFEKKEYSVELLKAIVAEDNKGRFAISDDGTKIRALQGHSTTLVKMKLQELAPPDILFHGTATKNLNNIYQTGLSAMKRHHVHLSDNEETATNVGSRHGSPFILYVDAKKMFEDGYRFYLSENNVWLTEKVPVEYIHKDLAFQHTPKKLGF